MLSISARGVTRGLVTLAVLAGWVVIGAFGGVAQGQLSQVQTNDASAFLPASAESTRAAEAGAAFVQRDTVPALVVLTPVDGSAVTADQLAAVESFADDLAGLPIDGAVPADGDPADVGALLVSSVAVVPAEDGAALLLPIVLDAEAASAQLADGGGTVAAVVTTVRAALADELGAGEEGEPGLNAWVTGPAGFAADLTSAFAGIDGVLLLVALGVVLLILVLVYRSPLLPVVVILSAVFALCAAALIVHRLAVAQILTLNGQSQGILSILVVGAAVDYSLLLVARYREELVASSSPYLAMSAAVRRCIEPISASAATVTAGLLCLLLSDLASNRSLGPVAAIGIASAYLASLTLLPALLLVPGPRSRVLFWPRRPAYADAAVVGGGLADPPVGSGELPVGLWGRLAGFVGRHARPVWVVTALAMLVGAAFLPTFRASGSSETDVFLAEVDSVAGQEVLARHFPAGAVQPAAVIAPEQDLAAVIDAATGLDGVESVMAFTGATGTPGAPSSAAEAVVVDGLVRVDVVTSDASDTPEAVRTVQTLRQAVHQVSPDALVGGATAQTLDTQIAGQRDLRVIVPAVLAVILLILMLLLRSVLAAVVLMAANVLSFAAAMGGAAILFNHVMDLPAADPTVPLYAFVFLIALGVDYSIFLLTRVREESVRIGTRPGVLRGLAVTGGVITSAGVVLAATFSALSVIPLLFMLQLAVIVAYGVLIDTLVVRSLLVPALVHDLGRTTWWPSALSRR